MSQVAPAPTTPVTASVPAAQRKPASLAEIEAIYPYVYPLRVNWSDMDALGHVNNVIYFRYLEATRISMMEVMDIFPKLFDQGSALVIADSRCRYKAPVVYPDTLQIGMSAEIMGEDRVMFYYSLFSMAQQRVVATAETLQVCVDPKTGRKKAMPDWFCDVLKTMGERS